MFLEPVIVQILRESESAKRISAVGISTVDGVDIYSSHTSTESIGVGIPASRDILVLRDSKYPTES